ncbi:hypothetical protein [Sphaerisporangium perillae]|uniref:hypothetical protein n=1 Tax=Sphaerisporangium perillae TaxID=2935860 RepID=UPI00200F3E4C|nr:hypothetical protein [Sphaerisporangium perillae]
MVIDTGAHLAQRHSWYSGVLITMMAVLVSFPLAGAGISQSIVTAVLALVTIAALCTRSASAIRATVFMDVLFLVFTIGIGLGWPPAITTMLVCVLPLAALLACGRVPSLRLAAPWLRIGRLTPDIPWLSAATIGGSAVALTLWVMAVKPAPSPYLRQLQDLRSIAPRDHTSYI